MATHNFSQAGGLTHCGSRVFAQATIPSASVPGAPDSLIA